MKKHLLSALLLSGSFLLNQGVVVAEAFPEEFRNSFSPADALLVGLETQGYVDPVSLKGNHQSTRVEQSQQNEESARRVEELLRAEHQCQEQKRREEELRKRQEEAAREEQGPQKATARAEEEPQQSQDQISRENRMVIGVILRDDFGARVAVLDSFIQDVFDRIQNFSRRLSDNDRAIIVSYIPQEIVDRLFDGGACYF